MTAELTIEQISRATENGNAFFAQLAKQLLATMQREAFLRETLTIIDMQALRVMQDDVPPRGAILRCGWVHEKCREALVWRERSADENKR